MAAGGARLLVPKRHWLVAGSPASGKIIETPSHLPIRYRTPSRLPSAIGHDPPTADRRPPTADRRPPTADRAA